VLRLDDIDEVRCTLGAGEEGCDSRVLRRDDGGSGTDLGIRPELDRCGNSVLEEFALELPRFASRAVRVEEGVVILLRTMGRGYLDPGSVGHRLNVGRI
jgi:hypothetical protein